MPTQPPRHPATSAPRADTGTMTSAPKPAESTLRPALRLRSLRFITDDEIELDFEGLDAPDATFRATRTWLEDIGIWLYNFDEAFDRLYRGVPIFQAGHSANSAITGAWAARDDVLPTGASYDRKYTAARAEVERRWKESHPDPDGDPT